MTAFNWLMVDSQLQENRFPSTDWSEIAAAGRADTEEGRSALGRLVLYYEPALVAYIQKKFRCWADDSARDVFQRFVAELIVAKQVVTLASPVEGRRFRSFLLTILHNFCISEMRKENASFRQPSGGLYSLDEIREKGDFEQTGATPANFDLEWARGVLTQAVEEMRAECMNDRLEHIWQIFEARLLQPILDGSPELSYTDLVSRLKFTSPAQAHNALITAKRKFSAALRRVVARYASPGAVETELADLKAILSQQPRPH